MQKLESLTIYIASTLFMLPLLVVISSLFLPVSDSMSHLFATVLPDYIINTILLIGGVGTLTFIIGVGAAWLVSNFDFFARRFLSYALFLPLAIPAYIAAYVYGGIFEYAGEFQSFLRSEFGVDKDSLFSFEIRSLGGAIIVMSLVLFPYVYMLSRIAFERNKDMINVARSLGLSYFASFYKVAIPAARPAIIGGLTLVLMETLSDFGAVQHFAVDVFTTGIYRSWYSMGDKTMSLQLAAGLLIFIVAILSVERLSRCGRSYASSFSGVGASALLRLTGFKNFLAFLCCAAPLFFGFILPVTQLISWSWGLNIIEESFLQALANSSKVSVITAIFAVIISLIFGYILKFSKGDNIKKLFIRFSAIGYAVPGSVVAVGVLVVLGKYDNYLDEKFSTGLLLSGSFLALIFAYLLRFLAVSLGSIEAGMSKITNEIHWSAKLMGCSNAKILQTIHMPIIRSSTLIAAMIVFVECVKELPATLIIRPFNFETLATRTYQLVSDERLYDASASALSIIGLAIIPVIFLSRGLGAKIYRD